MKRKKINQLTDLDNILNSPQKRLAFEMAAMVLTSLYDLTSFVFEATAPGASFGRLYQSSNDLAGADLRRWQVRKVLSRLISRKMIEQRDDIFTLTDKGKTRAQYYLINRLHMPSKPVRWDGYWRVVIFDIPEEHRFLRRVLRGKLKQLGFLRLQQSVWLYPFPCETVLQELIDRLSIHRHAAILRAAFLSDENRWLKRFAIDPLQKEI